MIDGAIGKISDKDAYNIIMQSKMYWLPSASNLRQPSNCIRKSQYCSTGNPETNRCRKKLQSRHRGGLETLCHCCLMTLIRHRKGTSAALDAQYQAQMALAQKMGQDVAAIESDWYKKTHRHVDVIRNRDIGKGITLEQSLATTLAAATAARRSYYRSIIEDIYRNAQIDLRW
jgi:hypothetical protein